MRAPLSHPEPQFDPWNERMSIYAFTTEEGLVPII